MKSFNRTAKGFAIITAIFILVVLAVLGSFIVNISTSQHIGSAIDVQGVRAYQAARAGIEWGLYKVTQDTNYATMTSIPALTTNTLTWCSSVTASNPSIASFGFTASSLNTLTVTVECYATKDGNLGPWIFNIKSTSCNQPVTGWTATKPACPNTTNPKNIYIERSLDVTF